MKKNLFILAAAAVALASCSSDDLISENAAAKGGQPVEIGVMPVAQTATRTSVTQTGVVNGTVFPTTLDMMVTAYDNTNSTVFFDATNFKHKYANKTADSGNDGWWGAETTPRYWPLSDTYLNFLAIANAGADNATGVTWGTNKADQVTVAMGNSYDAANQRDFMFAIGTAHVAKTGNALDIPNKVDMTFKHTLGYLQFRVRANSATEASGGDGAITITDIKVKGAHTYGTATIQSTSYNTTSAGAFSLNWDNTKIGYADATDDSNLGNAETYSSVTANRGAISYPLTQDFVEKGYLFVVPNMTEAFTGSNESVYGAGFTSFEISYKIGTNDQVYTYEYTPASTVVMAGKKYVFDITFKLHEIFVVPTVEDWVVTDEFVNIPSMTYGSNYTVPATGNKQTLKFTLAGFSGTEGNKYKVTVGGTNSDQVETTTPTTEAVALAVTTATVTANIKNATAAKTFTLTVQETESDGSTAVGTATVITVNQAAE